MTAWRHALAGLGLALGLAGPPAAAAPGPRPGAACPSGSIPVAVGSSLQAAVDAAPAGASFCIKAGEHRLQSVTPKDSQRFFGEAGAVLNGSRRLTSFSREGRFWVAHRQAQRGERRAAAVCLPGRTRCSSPEAFFIDDRPLFHAGSKQEVGEDSFFFDYDRERIYFAVDPAGRKVEASASPYAFFGKSRDVLIENLVVEKYAPPVQYGAIGYSGPSPGWVVRNNEVRLNYALGVSVGSGSRVLGNRIHGNGQMGAGCVGKGILFERNDIARNGYFSGVDPGWEGGAAKCALTEGLVVRRNHLRGNNGYGFWTDIDNIDTLYEENLVEDNAGGGISHEISYAAVIRNNTFRGNGPVVPTWLWSAAILIQNSRDVEVHGNTVDITGGGNGICLVQQDRGFGRYGLYVTANNRIHGNTLVIAAPGHGAVGAVADHDRDGMKASDNRFDRNLYRVHDPADDRWAWVDGFYAWAEYRARSGQDANSEVQVVPPEPGRGPDGG